VEKIFRIPSDEGTSALPAGPDSIIMLQLKEKFSETTNRSVKVTVLTLLPQDWSIRKIEEFPCVALKTGDTKEQKQKRLVLNNVSEVYAELKELHYGLKVGFLKFMSLHPKNSVLAAASELIVSVCALLIRMSN
jgi:hypothetical protein